MPVVLMWHVHSCVVYIYYTVCPLPAYLAVNICIYVRHVYTPATVKIRVIDCYRLLHSCPVSTCYWLLCHLQWMLYILFVFRT